MTQSEIQTYNVKIATMIEGWGLGVKGIGCSAIHLITDSEGNTRLDFPRYDTDIEAAHRALETATTLGDIVLFTIVVGHFACVKSEKCNDEGIEISSSETEDFTGTGRLQLSMYSALCRYVDSLEKYEWVRKANENENPLFKPAE